jgi:hypothetical protein
VSSTNTNSVLRGRPRGISILRAAAPSPVQQSTALSQFVEQFDLSLMDSGTQDVIKQKIHRLWEMVEANDRLAEDLNAKENLLAGIGQAGLSMPTVVKILDGEGGGARGKIIRVIPGNPQNLQTIVREVMGGEESEAEVRLRRKDGEIRDLDMPNLLMALAENAGEIHPTLVLIVQDG